MAIEMSINAYYTFLIIMVLTGVFVFITLFFETAGYGQFVTKKWGKQINNKVGWVVMEIPVVIFYIIFWLASDRRAEATPIVFSLIFLTHYIQRTFIFPMLIRGKDLMPLSIISFGMIFNTANACMQGLWIFYFAPATMYTVAWLTTPQFIIGTIIFFCGYVINLNADHIVRNLRPKDEKEAGKFYIPRGGAFDLFKVTSANYLGELTEWIGFAILTLSWPGLIFAFWTFCNLGPRANALRKWYSKTFGKEFDDLNRKRMIPFIY
jgi:3-oxo-5-alpha-steroid 4-dehydrogenase 1